MALLCLKEALRITPASKHEFVLPSISCLSVTEDSFGSGVLNIIKFITSPAPSPPKYLVYPFYWAYANTYVNSFMCRSFDLEPDQMNIELEFSGLMNTFEYRKVLDY